MLGERPVAEITTRDIVRLCESVTDRSPAQGAKALAIVKQMLRWCEVRAIVPRRPAAALTAQDLGIVATRRGRFLSPEEIPILWRALSAEPDLPRHVKAVETVAMRLGLKLLLLTGARSGEMLHAKWENVDLDRARTWTIPVCDQKCTPAQAQTAKDFTVPMSTTVVGLFRELHALANGSEHVLASAWASAGTVTQRGLLGALGRALAGTLLPGGPLTVHDLRRSYRTGLSRLGIAPHVAERALNHSLPPMLRVYDLHDFLPERREAAQKWDAYVLRLLAGEEAEVVVLHPPQPGSAP